MSGFLHLSDFHLVEDETTLSRAFNAKYILKNTVDKILSRKEDFGNLDGVIITGDISDDGSTESYSDAYNILKELQLPLLAIPGNHDLRQPMMNYLITKFLCLQASARILYTVLYYKRNNIEMKRRGLST